MKASDVAALYARAGFSAPSDISESLAEKVKGTRRKAVGGIIFRSTLEADCYQFFSLMQTAGAIRSLECQPKFVLQAKMRRDGKAIREIAYIADFRFERFVQSSPGWGEWKRVVVDAKGFRMQVYRIKRKMFLALYPDILFEEWTRDTLRDNSR